MMLGLPALLIGVLLAPAVGRVGFENDRASASCSVTHPNDPDDSRLIYGNDVLRTHLYPGGRVVFRPGGSGSVLPDGALRMKFGWWRLRPGELTIEGRRLDGDAPPLRAFIPKMYSSSFQATALIFPTTGCWEVTGRVGGGSLTFVTFVEKIGEGPAHAADGKPRLELQA